MPNVNDKGLALIKQFEGCELTAYQDAVGVWTIGYGHTGDVTEGESITQTEADQLLQSDVARFAQGVNDMVNRNLTPNQFAALVSFAYNVGLEALRESTLLACVNAGNFVDAKAQFSRWVYADGQALPGLVRRRTAEAQLFGE